MSLVELSGAAAVRDFIASAPHVVVTFSAHWCGPCQRSKPQLEALAQQYSHVQVGIVYEDTLGESIHEFNVRAFPTYILYVQKVEDRRIQGANMPQVQQMLESCPRGGTTMPTTGGATLGGGSSDTAVSAAEARAQRLAKLGGGGGGGGGNATITAVHDGNADKPGASSPGGAANNDINDNNDAKPDAGAAADVDMTDAVDKGPTTTDPTIHLDAALLDTLTNDMGFSLLRAQKGLLYGHGGTVEGAIEWLDAHQDDVDIDEPISAGAVAQSYKCNECGKILSNMANLELHANKTGHADFEESTEHVVPLTAEEKAAKVAEIKQLLQAKRAEREEAEKQENVQREKQRREMGKQMAKTREQVELDQRQREVYLRRKEKEDFRRERERLKAQLAADKAERAANKGKIASKLGVDGYAPDILQHEDTGTAAVSDAGTTGGNAGSAGGSNKKKNASLANIPDYLTKISSYKAGGDGGKCLKVLLAYVGNVADTPNEPKFRSINTENKIYKTKVKPLVGAKQLLLAVGFAPNESQDALVLADDALDVAVMRDAKAQIAQALEKY